MKSLLQKQLTAHQLWLGLMLLTLSTYSLGKFGFNGVWAMLFLIFIAVFKALIIMRDFMQLRNVSTLWQKIMFGWLAFVCGAISLSYILSI